MNSNSQKFYHYDPYDEESSDKMIDLDQNKIKEISSNLIFNTWKKYYYQIGQLMSGEPKKTIALVDDPPEQNLERGKFIYPVCQVKYSCEFPEERGISKIYWFICFLKENKF